MELNFGKYQGYELEDVPTSYLAYLLEQSYVNSEVKAECLDEINYRYSEFEMSRKAIERTIIDQAYKRLCDKYNRIGDNSSQIQIALFEFRQLLMKAL